MTFTNVLKAYGQVVQCECNRWEKSKRWKNKRKVDKQKEMEEVSVTQVCLCASPWLQLNYLFSVCLSDTLCLHSLPLYLYNQTNTFNRLSLNWKYTMPVHALKTVSKNKSCVIEHSGSKTPSNILSFTQHFSFRDQSLKDGLLSLTCFLMHKASSAQQHFLFTVWVYEIFSSFRIHQKGLWLKTSLETNQVDSNIHN